MEKINNKKQVLKFLGRIFLFLLPVVLLAYPADVFISKNLEKSVVHVAGEMIVWKDIYDGKINADIAIYGSSRAWVHFSPSILEDSLNLPAYNFGMDGLNFTFQYFRHKQYLKYNKKPKYIIISGDLFFFEEEDGFYNYSQIMPYMLFNRDYFKNRETFKVYNMFSYFIPLYRYSGQNSEILRALIYAFGLETEKPYRVKGYMGQDLEWTGDFEKAKKEKKQIEVNVNEKIKALFEQFIVECQADGIKVIIVYSPEYAGYREFVKNRSLITDTYKSIAEKYNLTFLDYSEDSISYDIGNFYNATHMNKKGSEMFIAKFASDIKGIIK